jgi:predicted O-methyltransferase YrrM
MIGVNGADDLDAQVAFLAELPFSDVPADVHETANRENGAVGYGPVEAAVLHAFIAGRLPERVVQIGAGVATAVMLRAAQSVDHRINLTCVDPYPSPYLREAARRNRITLVAEPAQAVSLERLADLDAGDLLFIDSTHVSRVGSDVNRLFLEIVPSLPAGVHVHVHDILWPYDYQRDILDGALFFWTESTLLHAFMIGNDRFTVRAGLSQLHYDRPEQLKRLIPWYQPVLSIDGLSADGRTGKHFPSSLYLEAM